MIKRTKIMEIVFCIVFSVFQTIGIFLYRNNTFKVIETAKDIYQLIGIFICMFCLSWVFVHLAVIHLTKGESIEPKQSLADKIIQAYGKHPVMWDIIIILLGWIPWLIAYYPGSLFYDMTHQLDQYYGGYSLQTHPPFTTLIMGLCLEFGKHVFHSDNFGLFTYILLQTGVCCYACCYSLSALRKTGTRNGAVIIALLFYAFYPIFGANAQCGEKDVIHYGLTLLAGTQYFLLCHKLFKSDSQQLICKELWLYILFCFFSSLCRKEMVILYLIMSAALFIYLLIKHKKILIAGIMAVTLLITYSANFISNNFIPNVIFQRSYGEGDSEMLSIPLQQVARYVKYEGDTLNDEEKKIIGDSFFYGYDNIASSYNPNISDPIKYNFNRSRAKGNGFWSIYKSLLKRNPGLFIESILASSYGYFSIVPNVPPTVDDAPTNGLPGGRIPQLYIELGPDRELGYLDIKFEDSLNGFRESLKKWIYAFEQPFNLLHSFGFYTWMILLFLIVSIMKKGWLSVFPFLIAVLSILVCIASPVNDYGRYYMSIIYLFPLMYGYTKADGKYLVSA